MNPVPNLHHGPSIGTHSSAPLCMAGLSTSPKPGSMGAGHGYSEDREGDLVKEISRLRLFLQQAGIDAERSSLEIRATEQRHTREIEGERAKAQAACAEADEIRHRLKNTLAVIQAIANATLRSDVPMEDARAAFDSRLVALARAHDVLFESNWATASLSTIIRAILAPHAARDPNRIRARGPEVKLRAKPALALGLALHELGTNAAKYGALSNKDGHVKIAWTFASVPQGREFRLRWRERNGPLILPPSRTGFGSRLIQRNLAAEFHGTVELEYEPDGLVCTICAPVRGLDEPRVTECGPL